MDTNVVGKITELRGLRAHLQQASALGFQQVTFRYENGRTILLNSNFTIPAGSITALVGLNGTGKTTVLRLLARLLKPTSGLVLPHDEDAILSYSSADGSDLNSYLRCTQVVQMLEEIYGDSSVANILKHIGLSQESRKRVWQLSSGQRKKLSLLRAFLTGHDAILLDEPESHLDFMSKTVVTSAIRRLRADTSVVFTSHDLEFIKRCDCTSILQISSDSSNAAHRIQETSFAALETSLDSLLAEVSNGY